MSTHPLSLSFLGAVVGAAALATAVTPAAVSAQTVIHACYVPASGTVYRIKAPNTPANCLQPTHVAFSWTDGADAFASLADAVKKTDQAAGDVTGVFSNLTVGKLLGRTLAATPPTEGQVLTWNAQTNQWEPKTVAGGGGGVSAHNQLTGLGNDDHTQYLLANGVRTANGFGVIGSTEASVQSAIVTTESQLSGMVFNASKGALRGGFASTGIYSWAQGNMGAFSLGWGDNTRASGFASVALGSEAVAGGAYSVSLGGFGQATGDFSFTVGGTSSALAAVSLGSQSIASGQYAFAASRGKALGAFSIALGGTATGSNSIAIGGNSGTGGQTGAIVISDNVSDALVMANANNQFVLRAQRIWFGTTSSPTATAGRYLETSTGAYLTTGGTWTNTSDSTRKTAFLAVDGELVLGKLAAIPVYTWQYLEEDAHVRHMGPTAQAFHKAFGLGDSDRAISTVDMGGVTLAGVKALETRTRSLRETVTNLRAENAELREQLAEQAARLARVEAALAQLSDNRR